MYEFVIPDDIQVTPSRSLAPEAISFYRFAKLCWLDDSAWLTPKSNLAHLLSVMKAIDAPAGEKAMLENADYEVLKKVVENPQLAPNGVPQHYLTPQVILQCSAFESAVLEATKV